MVLKENLAFLSEGSGSYGWGIPHFHSHRKGHSAAMDKLQTHFQGMMRW